MIEFANVRIISDKKQKMSILNILSFKERVYLKELHLFCILGVNKLLIGNYCLKIASYGTSSLVRCRICDIVSEKNNCGCKTYSKERIFIFIENVLEMPPFHIYYRIERRLPKMIAFSSRKDIMEFLFFKKTKKKHFRNLDKIMSVLKIFMIGFIGNEPRGPLPSKKSSEYSTLPYNTLFWTLRFLYKIGKMNSGEFKHLFQIFRMGSDPAYLSSIQGQLALLSEIKQKYKISNFHQKKSRIKRIYNILSSQYLNRTKNDKLIGVFVVQNILKIRFENIYSSASFPLVIKLNGNLCNEKVLYKNSQALKNDFFLISIFEYFHYLINHTSPSYEILLLDDNCAIIEMLDAEPLSLNHLSTFLEAKPSVQRSFLRTITMCILNTYLFGIGDRNNDNFLVTKNFKVFQIDFSFILGDDPKLFRKTIENTIRIPTILRYILKFDILLEEMFKKYFFKYFRILKRNKKKIDLLFHLLELHPCMKLKKIKRYLFKKLKYQASENEILEKLEYGINRKLNKWIDLTNKIGKYLRK